MQLATISSGVAPAYNARSATITNQTLRGDLAVHISGGRGDSNSFLIDGVETRSSWFNSPMVLLSVDAVQEFKIDKNMFAAEYGQGNGVVSLVSKSGVPRLGVRVPAQRQARCGQLLRQLFRQQEGPVPAESIRCHRRRRHRAKQNVLLRKLGGAPKPAQRHADSACGYTCAIGRRPHRAALHAPRPGNQRSGHFRPSLRAPFPATKFRPIAFPPSRATSRNSRPNPTPTSAGAITSPPEAGRATMTNGASASIISSHPRIRCSGATPISPPLCSTPA